MNKFTVGEKSFLLNGEPFRVVAGAMHYFRVPREYWRDRLMKIKACGFNTVETYTAWNLHEPAEGRFDFSGNLDLKAYLELIGELGMFAIVRPGPYICSEWDFGGLPWWLLKYNDIPLRCADPRFLEKTETYFSQLIPIIAAQQVDCGGPVIMVQVENEYGSYGNDSVYLRCVADCLKNNGITCTLFTSDGANDTMLSGGTVPEILKTVNFGSRAEESFRNLRRFQKDGPLMCAEYWNGWFDHWGEKHHRRDPADAVKSLREILNAGASVSVYMMHGGTNFGYMNGANCFDGDYQPTVNSYDDDAPINEYGGLTEKYFAFKHLLAEFGHANDVELDPVPGPAAYPPVTLTETADLLSQLDLLNEPVLSVVPKPMEKLGQGYGFICYKAKVKGPKEKETLRMTVRDRAYIFAGEKFLGIYDRNDRKQNIRLEIPAEGLTLTILVENMGRTNYGPEMADRKGIPGDVRLGNQFLYHWETYCLPLDNVENCAFSAPQKLRFEKRPLLLRGALQVEGDPRDTFVSLPGFKKGVILVNGRVLSRYWEKGPQHTAYLPAPWLRSGENEIVVLELEGFKKPEVRFEDAPDIG